MWQVLQDSWKRKSYQQNLYPRTDAVKRVFFVFVFFFFFYLSYFTVLFFKNVETFYFGKLISIAEFLYLFYSHSVVAFCINSTVVSKTFLLVPEQSYYTVIQYLKDLNEFSSPVDAF